MVHDFTYVVVYDVVRTLYLQHVTLHGTHFRQEVLSTIVEGQPVELVPEPDNPHDPYAVAVVDSSGRQLGYIPRVLNQFLAGAHIERAQVERLIRWEDSGELSCTIVFLCDRVIVGTYHKKTGLSRL